MGDDDSWNWLCEGVIWWQVGEINVGRQRYTLSLSAPLKIIIILGDQMLKKYNFILDN